MRRLHREGIASVLACVGLACSGAACAGSANGAQVVEAPRGPPSVLTWTPEQQVRLYPRMETVLPVHVVRRGATVRELPSAHVSFDPKMRWGGRDWTIDDYMKAYRVSGLLIMHDGKVLTERYGLGRKPDDRWTSFSVAKSVTSLLVGAAIRDGKMRLEDRVVRFVPELAGSAYADVTLRQMLTMSSGVAWNEDYSDPKSDTRRIGDTKSQAETFAYLAKLPRVHPAGAVFHYNTAETSLVGVMLSRAVGMTLADYLSDKIWKPYGMEQDAAWIVDESGQEQAGCCLSMTLRDFARVGQFALEDGRIDGQPVTAPGWVADSTRVQIANGHPAPSGYGYFWWIGPKAYEASGIFGQSILVYPKDRLIMVVNSAWPHPDAPALFAALSEFQGAIHDAVVSKEAAR